MHKHRIFAVTVATLFVFGTPAFSQSHGGDDLSRIGAVRDYNPHDLDPKKIGNKPESKPNEELVAGVNMVKQQKYTDAIPHLELALTDNSNNATIFIYLGFSHRMLGAGLTGDAKNGEYAKALGYYMQGLQIAPDNKLLHEYLGKLYLLMYNQPSAEKELKTLETLCPSGCEERDTLSNVLIAYGASMALTTPPAK